MGGFCRLSSRADGEKIAGRGVHLLRHEKRDELMRSPSCDVLEPGAGSYQQEPVLHISSQPGI